ncbi:MAG: ABC transporter ATP-binding protein [Planctomycetaceae bacterium]|nr:ABC transporter ATP-binding protein [Planctomycetaceae bacterium]
MVLELSHVTKVYSRGVRSVRALDDVSFQVDAGEFVSLVGPSGCGKTTLLLIAGGLLRPDTGAVTVAGAEPYTLSPEQRSRFRVQNVGFVFQQFHLVPYLSVRENILSPVLAWWKGGLHERADQLIERFGLGPRRDHRPGELSTGERQRTALARALLHQPKVILADEPTGNLDAPNADLVLRTLRECADEGAAVLLVTHDSSAADRADRVVPMQAGQVAEASLTS